MPPRVILLLDGLTWKDYLDRVDQELPTRDSVARKALDRLSIRLGDLPGREDNFGLIHYDFKVDNLIWNNHLPGIIDFDDCAGYWFVADIAYALRDLCDDRVSQVDLSHPSFKDFMRGYRLVRPVSDEELAQVPLLFLMVNLGIYTELGSIVTEGIAADEPEWTV